MPSPSTVLASKVTDAIIDAFGDDARGADPALRPSQFADLQSNAALSLARRVGLAPRDAAQRLIDHLRVEEICAKAELSGPGYINLTLSDRWIARQVSAVAGDGRLGVPRETPQRVVIDYSAPNVAKEMHVGHLRTTVVGDALARVLEHLGHTVIRQNHIGDWGTPFGMLIEHLLDVGEDSAEARRLATDPNAFYQSARAAFDTDPAFATRARARVVALQAGDEETLRLWAELVELSRQYFAAIYSRLGVSLTDADLAGESTYNDDLPRICEELEAQGIATVSQGALCVFLPGYTGRESEPVPLIVRKSDGGYGYGTTDLAAVRHRIGTLHADRLIYVIGAPQALHLSMVWETAREAGWLPPEITPVHVQIGNVLGPDRKILKTRSGAPLRLAALLDEAVATARAAIDEDRPELDEPTRSALAPLVGIGAVKYADLSVGHDTEYVFDLERMVALNGNTSRYLQYAAARLRSLLRKAGVEPEAVGSAITVGEPAERALALLLLDFGEVVSAVGRDLEPHRLCTYLFELAQTFSVFYEQCAVLTAEPEVRASRLALCALTLRVLVTGLDLLGIASPDTM
ncbi:arginine--tRNA ligase [Microbacterium sp. p3-SID336]|uniref:arginine--tRNA ligase n=1 Tax=Microbacterium sp. p3-SID336 TaxID=2916212 RepID=UPI0021A3C8B2|nr:arginine--tRNA ligase [Microbacterium sp. p3-SID336]MCT1479383.1 arginine--tRNA ligase [Microbacterium sp. p3-SID336]